MPATAENRDEGAEDAWQRLRAALHRTTVALTSVSGSATGVGTGVFIAPGTVLTCAHVVLPNRREADSIEGVWTDGDAQHRIRFEARPKDIHPFADGSGPDLALLRATSGAPEAHPCAAIARGGTHQAGGELYAHGHPGHQYRRGDSLTFDVEGASRHTAGADLLKVIGAEVSGGHSGSPVIDRRTGCVIGLVRASQRKTGPGGGWEARLVPAAAVRAAFPGLDELQRPGEDPGLDSWLRLLDDDQLRHAEWPLAGPRMTGYLTLLREATDYSGYLEALSAALRQEREPARLGNVYVPVRAKAGFDDEESRARCIPVDHASLSAGAHIVGAAGTGKSTLLRAVAKGHAEHWLGGALGDYVPVYAAAPDLARYIGQREWEPFSYLASAVRQDLRQAASACAGELSLHDAPVPRPGAFARPPYPARKWLVLVDAVDEVTDVRLRKDIDKLLLGYANSPYMSLVVTSRQRIRVAGRGNRPLSAISLCHLDDAVRRELIGNCLEAFGVGGPGGAHADHVERLLLWLGRFGLLDLALRPMLCVALCAVYGSEAAGVSGIGADATGGRYAVFGKIVEILLKGAAQRDTAVPVQWRELRALLEEYTGPRIEQGVAPAPRLDSLVLERLGGHKPAGSDADWCEAVRLHLYASGLLIPAVHGEPVFSHQTLGDYLAARYWTRTAPLDGRSVRQVAKDSRMAHAESFALFRAAPLLAERPEVIGSLLRTWRTGPRRDAAVLVAKLCAEAAPVPDDLRARAAAVLTDWGRTAQGAPPASMPARPDDQDWAHWARRQGKLLSPARPPVRRQVR